MEGIALHYDIRMQTLDFRLLEILAAVAETGSMSAAASRLRISQPAVSQAVARLEAALDCTMIDRRRRPLRPTEEGQVALRAAEELAHGIAALPERIRAVRQLPLRLRLGVVDSLTFPFLPMLCMELGRDVEFLSVSSGLVQALRDALTGGALDFVISNDAMEDLDHLTRHEIAREPYILAVPSSLGDPASLSLEALAQALPLVRWGQRSLLARDVEAQLRRLRLAVPRKFDLESAGALLGMVAAGLGWAVVTPMAVLQAADFGQRLTLLPFPGPSFSRTITLVAPRHMATDLPLRIANASRRVMCRLAAEGAFRAMPFAEIRVSAEEVLAKGPRRRPAANDRLPIGS